MGLLKIDNTDKSTIKTSFDGIAKRLFEDYYLRVNDNCYRLIDIEFYYHTPDRDHKDEYTHKHDLQLKMGTWYFHGSGIDITIGNGKDKGGILLRGIACIKKNANPIEIHGPHKVMTEICSNFFGVLKKDANTFNLELSNDKESPSLKSYDPIFSLPRVNLNPLSDPENFNNNYRYLDLDFIKQLPKGKVKIWECLKDKVEEKKLKELLNWQPK